MVIGPGFYRPQGMFGNEHAFTFEKEVLRMSLNYDASPYLSVGVF